MTPIRIDKVRGRRGARTRVGAAVDGGRFAARGDSAVYRILTLLYLAGHVGRRFEVWDDVSPTGGPGGLASHGRVRNYARRIGQTWTFMADAQPDPGFTAKQAAAAKAARA